MISVKVLVLVMALWNLAEAQRSFYASRPRSKLLPKFKQNETETTTENLVNRGGEEEENLFGNPGVDNRNTDLEGTLEDQKFLNRVAQWPDDRQPFWFKNRKHISNMRGQEAVGGDSNQQQSFGTRFNPQFQSPFAGNRNGFNRESGTDQQIFRRRNYEELDLPSRVNFVRNRPRYLARDD